MQVKMVDLVKQGNLEKKPARVIAVPMLVELSDIWGVIFVKRLIKQKA